MLNTSAADWVAPRVLRYSPADWKLSGPEDWKRHKSRLRTLAAPEEAMDLRSAPSSARELIDLEQFRRNREVGRMLLKWLEEDPEPNPEVEADIKRMIDSIRHDP